MGDSEAQGRVQADVALKKLRETLLGTANKPNEAAHGSVRPVEQGGKQQQQKQAHQQLHTPEDSDADYTDTEDYHNVTGGGTSRRGSIESRVSAIEGVHNSADAGSPRRGNVKQRISMFEKE